MLRDSLNWNLAYRVSVLLIAASSWLLPVDAYALPVSHQLPMDLAVEAAIEAVKTCKKQGYYVTATTVTKEGLRQVVIRGDGAPPHTIENSYNKAYTIITLGPIQKVASTTEIVKSVGQPANPVGNWSIAPSPLPGISFSSGGVAVKVGNEIIAGLGVSGSPGVTTMKLALKLESKKSAIAFLLKVLYSIER